MADDCRPSKDLTLNGDSPTMHEPRRRLCLLNDLQPQVGRRTEPRDEASIILTRKRRMQELPHPLRAFYMAKKSMIVKAQRKPKFKSRVIRRCFKCGRPRGFLRDFNLCRICFREEALEGNIPGIKKSSW